jgi:hypothetical protein
MVEIRLVGLVCVKKMKKDWIIMTKFTVLGGWWCVESTQVDWSGALNPFKWTK